MSYVLHERFDAWAETYDQSLVVKWNRYIQRKVLSEVVSDTNWELSTKKVLDFACGTGYFIQLMMDVVNDEAQGSLCAAMGDLCGIDYSKEMIKQAKAKLGKRFDLRHACAEDTTFEDGRFDYVVCTTAFHHFPNPIDSIKEMRRVLKVGGKIIIADINFLPLSISNRIFKRIEEDFVSMYSKAEFRRFARESGLNVVKQNIIGLFGLMSVFEKPVTLKIKKGKK